MNILFGFARIGFNFGTLNVLVLIVVMALWLRFSIWRRKYSQLIPSRKLLFIDLMGDGYSFNFDEETYCGYSRSTHLMKDFEGFFHLFKDKPFFCWWVSYLPFVCMGKPEPIEKVLSGTKVHQKAWSYDWLHCWLGTGLLTSKGQKWKSRRKLLTPAFHFDILKDFMPVIQDKSMQLIKKLEKETTKEYTDIASFITLCSLDVICETTLGINIEAQKNEDSKYVKAVAKVSHGLVTRITNAFSWFDFTYFLFDGKSLIDDLKMLHQFTTSVIQEKKKQLMSGTYDKLRKRKPLIDILLKHHLETKELSDQDIREEVDTFTFEGHDTVSMALTWTLYLIGLHKDVQNKLYKELNQIYGDDNLNPVIVEDFKYMNYLECVIKESMRIYPPVPVIGRKADKNMEICGIPIPKGSTIVISIYSVHRDEKTFPNPEIFDPDRFTPEKSASRHPYAYIPFSAGSRNCIGQRFAMMEIKTVLANILRNYELESLDPRDKIPPAIETILRPSKPVRIKFRPRKNFLI